MHAGRGDLRQLRYDLASGALTGAVPTDYVLLLQEAIQPVDAAGLSFFFGTVRGHSGNAVLSTRPLLNAHVVTLPRERQPRSAIAASIRLDAATLFIVDVHMENRVAWWRALFSDTARGEQAAALLRDLPQGDGILGGDLNTWLGPNEPAWRAMLQRFPDTPRDPPEPTFHNRLVLDHLFFDLPERWTVASRRVISNAYGSDHHPVIAVLSD
jgi:endonuclease/exonuclease/phosphatase family metal-dependent hydrolase